VTPSAPSRRAFGAVVAAVVASALVVTGFAMPAAAAETSSLTVSVRSVEGTPLAGLTIYAVSVAGGREIVGDNLSDGSYPTATAVVGKPGVYYFAALGGFDHTLYFATATSTTFAQLLGGASDVARAQVVPAGQTTLSVSLATNAVISGTVKSPSAKAMSKAYVTAYRYTGSEWERYSTARTDTRGRYKLIDLDPGSYKLKFEASGGTYSPLYSGGVSRLEAATAYSVGVAGVSTVDASFPKATGAITGTGRVSYWDGEFRLTKAHAIAIPVTVTKPYAAPRILALDLDNSVASVAMTSSGKWAVNNLVPGTYVVKVVPAYYNENSVWIAPQPTGKFEDAQVFTVTAGSTSKAVVALPTIDSTGAALSLSVRSGSGAAVPDADVLLQSDVTTDYYFAGKTSQSGALILGQYGSKRVIQPGRFSLVITTGGRFAPSQQFVDLTWGTNQIDVRLDSPPAAAGFVAVPSIAQHALAVNTSYVVSAQPKRSTATLTYQWMRDGRPIWGADSATYISRPGDIGSQLSVVVSSHDFGYPVDEATASVAGLVVSTASVPTATSAPVITPSSGSHVGTVLHVVPGTWSVQGLSFHYAWSRDGIPFNNDSDSYEVTLADLDSEFTVQVTASKSGHPDATATTPVGVTPAYASNSQPRSGLLVSISKTGLPSGSLRYTVSPGTWTAPSPSFSYQWLRGGVELPGETDATLIEKATTETRGQTLEVRVSASERGFGDSSTVVTARKAISAVQRTELPVASIDGGVTMLDATSTVEYGNTITVTGGAWVHGVDDIGELTLDYQWLRKFPGKATTALAAAVDHSYTPALSDIGASLSVRITAHSSRWGDSLVTVPAGKIAGTSDLVDALSAISLSGPPSPYEYDTPAPNLYIHAPDVTPWTTLGAVVTYQWYACKSSQCNASTSTSKYTKVPYAHGRDTYIQPEYGNGRIFVTMTATKAGSRTAHYSTPPVRIASSKQILVKTSPIMGGGAPIAPGSLIPATASEFRNATTVTRVWQVCSQDCLAAGAIWTQAEGVGTTSFVPDRSAWGSGNNYLRVADTATRSGYYSATAYSAPAPIVAGKLGAQTGLVLAPITVTAPGQWQISAGQGTTPAFVTSTTEWFVDGESRSTESSFTALESDAAKRIYVVRRFVAVGYEDFEKVDVVQSGSATSLTARTVSVVGSRYGETLSLSDPVPWDLPDVPHANWVVSYTWTVGTEKIIGGPTFTPRAWDPGYSLNVKIQATSPIFGTYSTTTTLAGGIKAGAALTIETPLDVTWHGDLEPGVTLSSSELTYPVAGVTTVYAWESSVNGTTWVAIAGATSSTYRVALTDSLRSLRLHVYASKSGYGTFGFVSGTVQVLEGHVIRLLGIPVLTGDARVGETLTTTEGTWTDGAAPYIQWLLNGRAIPGATNTTYVPLAQNVGDEISVRVTGKQSGRLDVVAETSAVTIAKGAAPTVVTAPVISGTTTLTATPGVWTVSGLTFAYEWRLDGDVVGTTDTVVLLPDTTKADYTLTVRATRYGYEAGEYTTP
jgi:hypothetical protein